MIKVRELVQKEICSFKGFLSQQNFQGAKSKEYYISIALKKVIELLSMNDMCDKKTVSKILRDCLPREIFISKSEMEKDIELFINQIVRYARWEKVNDRTVLRKSISHTIELEGENIKVDADLILDDTKKIEVIKIKRKTPEMTLRGRKIDTDPNQSLELYFLQKLGQFLYPERIVCASIVYLASKDDKKEFGDFEKKKGANVITNAFEPLSFNTVRIEERIVKILRDEGNASSSKCEGNHCDKCQFKNLCYYTHIDNSNLEKIPKISKAKDVKLTFQQKEYTKFENGFLRINAVAGSGKTLATTRRVVNLIKNSYYNPKDFLLITYTEKGVRELKEKLQFWIDIEGMNISVNDIKIRTFNGFCYDIIKEEFKQLGFIKEPQLIDKMDKYDIISNILDEEDDIPGLNYRYPLMDMFSAKGAIVKTSEFMDEIKNNGFTYPEEAVEILGVEEEYAYRMFSVYIKFQNKMKELNLLQYQDQLNYCIELLTDTEMVEKYGFKHITIDEVQDTSQTEMYVVRQLVRYSEFTSLCVCGDDSQSIFSFKGTSQDNILNFDKEFPGVRDIMLKKNFRSTNQISSLANKLNALNTRRIDKEIVSNKDGEKPMLRATNLCEIVQYVKEQIEKGVPKHEIAVIARTKAELLQVEKALKSENVTCLLATTEVLRDNNKVKNIIGFANFLLDNKLNLHFAEILQVIKYEEFINSSNLKAFVLQEKEKFVTEFEQKNDLEKVEMFYELLEPIRSQDRAVSRLIDVCKLRGFIHIEDLAKFIIKLDKYSSEIAIEKDDNVYNAVVLTTAHASKGREYQVVISIMDKYDYNMKNIDRLEEERRLLFVTITRAKETLLLTYNSYNKFVHEVEGILK